MTLLTLLSFPDMPSGMSSAIAAALSLAILSTGAAQATDSSAVALMREHKCYVCHANDEELAGPAFVDVAAKYRLSPDGVGAVAAVIRRGKQGGGPWHMPPHPELSPEDARAIAEYILSLDQRRIPSAGEAPR